MVRTLALLFTLSLAWGCSFLFIELALRAFPPLLIVQLRLLLGAALLLVWLLAQRQLPLLPRWRDSGGRGFWTRALVMGLFNNLLPFLLIVTAQTALTSGVTSILNATMPFYTLLIALALGEVRRITPTLLGLAFGFFGVLLLAEGEQLAALLGGKGGAVPTVDGPPLWALLAMSLAALSYAGSSFVGRGLVGLASPAQAAAGMLLLSALLLLPVTALSLAGVPFPAIAPLPLAELITRTHLAAAGSLPWLGLLGLGSLSTGFAYLIYYALMRQAGPTITALVTFLLPLVALSLGAVLLGESYRIWALLGGLSIFAGLALVFYARRS